MTSYTVTTKVNNPNYDCSADFTNTAFDKAVEYIIRVNNTKYEAISGATGRLVYGGADDEGSVDGDDDSAVIAAVLAAVTSGVVLLNGVAFDLTQFGDIPENVRVVCDYGAEHWEYINSADSSGSPYTVSVGSGVNAGYYLAADSEGRICWSSRNVTYVFANVAASVSSGGFVNIGAMDVTLSGRINWPAGVNVVGSGKEVTRIRGVSDVFSFNSGGTLAFLSGGLSDLGIWVGDGGTGVLVDAVFLMPITDCLFWKNGNGTDTIGIKFINAAYECSVTRCHFGFLSTCILIAGGTDSSNGVLVSECDIAPLDGGVGIHITEGVDGCKIDKNWIEFLTAGAGGKCILIEEPPGHASRNNIQGNFIHGGYNTTTSYGIYLSCSNTSIANNDIYVAYGTGIYVNGSYNDMTGNKFQSTPTMTNLVNIMGGSQNSIIGGSMAVMGSGVGVLIPESGTAIRTKVSDVSITHSGYRVFHILRGYQTITNNLIYATSSANNAIARLADNTDFTGNTISSQDRIYGVNGVVLYGDNCSISGNSFTNLIRAISIEATMPNTQITNNRINNCTTTIYLSSAIHQVAIKSNLGYNPKGYIANPFRDSTAFLVDSGNNATISSDMTYTNTQSPKMLYVSGGTVTTITVNGQATGLTSGSIMLNPADTFSITFSSAPTLKVMGQ